MVSQIQQATAYRKTTNNIPANVMKTTSGTTENAYMVQAVVENQLQSRQVAKTTRAMMSIMRQEYACRKKMTATNANANTTISGTAKHVSTLATLIRV